MNCRSHFLWFSFQTKRGEAWRGAGSDTGTGGVPSLLGGRQEAHRGRTQASRDSSTAGLPRACSGKQARAGARGARYEVLAAEVPTPEPQTQQSSSGNGWRG